MLNFVLNASFKIYSHFILYSILLNVRQISIDKIIKLSTFVTIVYSTKQYFVFFVPFTCWIFLITSKKCLNCSNILAFKSHIFSMYRAQKQIRTFFFSHGNGLKKLYKSDVFQSISFSYLWKIFVHRVFFVQKKGKKSRNQRFFFNFFF